MLAALPAQYPDMVAADCPIAGSARTASFNKAFLMSLRRALELDPAYNEGYHSRTPVAGIRAFASIYAGWGRLGSLLSNQGLPNVRRGRPRGVRAEFLGAVFSQLRCK
jgi:hypothetical protein